MKNKILTIFITCILEIQCISIYAQNYVPGTFLLQDNAGAENKWGQRGNSNGKSNCTPCFNQYCPSGSHCGHTLVGCGAVAMAQIMWKWQYPQSSSYRTYNWNLMPAQLLNDQIAEGEEIAHFLRDCGDAVNMRYWEMNTGIDRIDETLTGSFSFIKDVEDAFKNVFNYKSVTLYSKSDWGYGSAWEDLIRAEIDAGRPVFYNGMTNLTNGHFFVIDGYDATDPSKFHVNWGWNDGSRGTFYLNNLNGYNSYQKAIIGISPTYPYPNAVNITDVSYTTVTTTKKEEAQQNIILPASGKTLTVKNGGNLTLVAGNKISFKQGFKAEQGSRLTAKIDPMYAFLANNVNITVPGWPNAFYSTDPFYIWAYNANTYNIVVVNRWNNIVYQGAGTISNNRADLWDGADVPEGVYTYHLELRNNYGRLLKVSRDVTVLRKALKSFSLQDSIVEQTEAIEKQSFANDIVTVIFDDDITEISNDDITEFPNDVIIAFPNPTNGTVNLNITKPFNYCNIKLYTMNGALVYSDNNVTQSTYTFDLSGFVDGVYTVQIQIDNVIENKKITLLR